MSKFFLLYFLIINLTAFILMGLDKSKARRRAWRIPERTLFVCAALGGSIGSILGMQLFRHKTHHRTFVLGMPGILVLQLLIAGLFWYFIRG